MAVTNMRIMVRRDTEAMWLANGDNTLLEGEIGYELDSRKMKIGFQSKSYSELPYFAGGIVDLHPTGGLKLDEAGNLYLDNDMVLGELPADTNIKAYVDGLVQGEGSIRTQEDQLLSDRIDTVSTTVSGDLTTESSNRQAADSSLQQQVNVVSSNLTTETTTRTQQDALLLTQIDLVKVDITTETSNRQAADISLQQQDTILLNQIDLVKADITTLETEKAALSGANFTGVITAPMGENVIPFFFTDQAAFPPAADAHGAILHSHADAAMFFAHAGAYHQVLDANTAYNKTEVDAALLLKADLTGATFTGAVAATEFQGPLNGNVLNHDGTVVLLDNTAGTFTGNVNGNTAGVSTGQHFGPVFKADTQLSPVVVLNPGTGAGAVATYEGDLWNQGGLVKMVDSVSGTFNGELTGNTTGNHTGNVVNANSDIIVDVANAKFNGDVTGNLTGNTVGSHYGSVYADDTTTLIIDGATGNIVANASFTGDCTFTEELTVNNTIRATNAVYGSDIGGTVWGDLGNAPALAAQNTVTDASTAAEIAAAITALQTYIASLNTRLTNDQTILMP